MGCRVTDELIVFAGMGLINSSATYAFKKQET